MKNTDKKTIAVVGATGAQGGGLVRAILADRSGQWAARAVTRNPGSKEAQALAELGAEVVAADLDDVASLERAFQGADAAFLVTFFWAHFSPETELLHAENMARAAKAAGVGHVIWSTLEDTRKWVPLSDDRMPTLKEKYKVPHFDAKGAANQIFAELGVPTTYLNTSFYWENFIYFGMGPKRDADGTLTITLPMGDAKLPGIAAADIGKVALAIFERGSAMIGKTVGIAGDHVSGADMAAKLSKALGQPVRYQEVSPDVYRGFGFPGADDLGNMFQVKRDFETQYRAARDLDAVRALHPSIQSFDSWAAENAHRIPLA